MQVINNISIIMRNQFDKIREIKKMTFKSNQSHFSFAITISNDETNLSFFINISAN